MRSRFAQNAGMDLPITIYFALPKHLASIYVIPGYNIPSLLMCAARGVAMCSTEL